MRIAIYTAIYGGKDDLNDPHNFFNSEQIDYFCFTDDFELSSSVYKIILKDPPVKDLVKKSKYIKIKGSEELEEYDFLIWHDGNIQIDSQKIFEMIKYLGEEDFATFKHPHRNNIYDEIITCINRNKGNKIQLLYQFFFYLIKKAPSNATLFEAGIFIKRRGRRPEFLENWWRHIKKYSIRDQIPLGFLTDKMKISIAILPGRGNLNEFSIYHEHNYKSVTIRTPSEVVIKKIMVYMLLTIKKKIL